MIPMTVESVARAIGASLHPARRQTEVTRVVTDSRRVQRGDLFFAIRGERFDGHDFIADALNCGAAACVCDRNWLARAAPARTELRGSLLGVTDTVRALGCLAAHYRGRVMPPSTHVVAVTGSNGKTTTKTILDHVLSGSLQGRSAPRSFNNHIGVPLTLLSADAADRYLIVEIGSNAPGEVADLSAMASPHVGVITSIGEAHLEGLGDVEGVAREKGSLLKYIQPDGLAVVHGDRSEIHPYLDKAGCGKVITVGTGPVAKVCVRDLMGDLSGCSFVLHDRYAIELALPGTHHASNAAIAFTVARWFGLAPNEITGRLRSFTPLDGRSRRFMVGDTTIVDDAYNANPSSMLAAIRTLARGAADHRMMVMGDMLELGASGDVYHRKMVEAVAREGIEVLVAVGPAMAEAVRATRDRMNPTRAVVCMDAAQATGAVISFLPEVSAVWIKGSRAMGLDRIVSDLEAFSSRRGGRPPAAQDRHLAGVSKS